MAGFMDKYVSVAERIARFYDKHPDGSIITELVGDELITIDAGKEEESLMAKVTFKATLLIPNGSQTGNSTAVQYRTLAVGYAQETDESSKIDKYFENTETSAIGRALANAGFQSTDEARASKEEMESADRAGVVKKKLFKKNRG